MQKDIDTPIYPTFLDTSTAFVDLTSSETVSTNFNRVIEIIKEIQKYVNSSFGGKSSNIQELIYLFKLMADQQQHNIMQNIIAFSITIHEQYQKQYNKVYNKFLDFVIKDENIKIVTKKVGAY